MVCSGEITSSLKKFSYNITTPTVSYEDTESVSEVDETIFVYRGYFAAEPTNLVFEDVEISSSVTLASTTSANSSMLTSSQTSINGPIPSVAASPSGQQGTLSSGAKAGIGVGVALGVCVMVALGFLIYRSRKRKTAGERSTSGGERPKSNSKQMKPEELSDDAMRDHELPDSSRQELEEHHAVAEAHDQS